MYSAPDDKPTSLPPATLKEIADALARGEYLQVVECYWNPDEMVELKELAKGLGCTIQDMRFRHCGLNVADLPRMESRLTTLEAQASTFVQTVADAEKALRDVETDLRERNVDYFKRETQPEYIEADKAVKNAKKALTNHEDVVRYSKSQIKATKEWKPERRIVASFSYNDLTTDATIKKIDDLMKSCPNLCPKLTTVVRLRKAIMAEMNKSRGTPMRNVYLDFNMTPMDYRIQASWVIRRPTKNDYSWVYNTHYLHITEYNLYGDEVVEYKSKEQLMSEEEKKQAEEKKKTPYADYFSICMYDIERATSIKVKNTDGTTSSTSSFKYDHLIHDEEWETNIRPDGTVCISCLSVRDFIATDVNHKDNTFKIIGYIVDGEIKIKKTKEIMTVNYPAPKTSRTKTTQLQKDLKKLMQNYEIPE